MPVMHQRQLTSFALSLVSSAMSSAFSATSSVSSNSAATPALRDHQYCLPNNLGRASLLIRGLRGNVSSLEDRVETLEAWLQVTQEKSREMVKRLKKLNTIMITMKKNANYEAKARIKKFQQLRGHICQLKKWIFYWTGNPSIVGVSIQFFS